MVTFHHIMLFITFFSSSAFCFSSNFFFFSASFCCHKLNGSVTDMSVILFFLLYCVRYGEELSALLSITPSIIQGSAFGPASYVVNAADLTTVTSGNQMPTRTLLFQPSTSSHVRTSLHILRSGRRLII